MPRTKRGPIDPAAKGIRHRHAIEQHQRARRSIAAEAAERCALAGWMGRTRIGTAKLMKTRRIAQDIFQPPGGRSPERRAIDDLDVIGQIAKPGGQALSGHPDFKNGRASWREKVVKE